MNKEKWAKISYIALLCLLVITSLIFIYGNGGTRYEETKELKLSGMYPSYAFHEYTQEITPQKNGFYGFSIMLYTQYESCDDTYTIRLFEHETGSLVQEWTIHASTNIEGERYKFILDQPLMDSCDKIYDLEISIEIGEGSLRSSLCTTTHPSEELGPMTIQGELYEGQALRTTFFYQKNMTIWKILFSLMLLGGLALIPVLSNMNMEKLAAVMLIAWGALYFVAIPAFQVPDETGHYYRSYEIAQGDFLTPQDENGNGVSMLPGNLIPEQMMDLQNINYKMIRDCMGEKLDPVRIPYGNPTQALYSPISYLPQAIGCFIAKCFTQKTIIIFYFARFINALACGLMTLAAIRLIPYGKRFLFLVACMPMYLQQMISLSSDAFINAGAMLLLAIILHLMVQEEAITWKGKILLALCSFCVALCKVVYLPLCFMVFLVPADRFHSKKQSVLYKVFVAGISTVLNLGWLAIGFGYLIEFRPGVDSGAQIRFILTHIPSYIGVVLRTTAVKWFDWLGTMVGAKMGRFNILVFLPFVAIYLIVLIFECCILDEQEKNSLSSTLRVGMVLLFLIVVGITLTSLYVQWTAYQNPYIEGFQGRYFIPVIPLVACGTKGKRIQATNKDLMKWYLPFIVVLECCSLFSIVTYFA